MTLTLRNRFSLFSSLPAPALVLGASLLAPGCFDPAPDGSSDDAEAGSTTGDDMTQENPTLTSGGATAGGESSGTAPDEGSTSSGDESTTGDDGSTGSDGESGETGSTGEPEPTVCGDGIVDASEACDDGSVDGTDFCNACALAPDLVLSGIHLLDTDAGTLDGVALHGWNADAPRTPTCPTTSSASSRRLSCSFGSWRRCAAITRSGWTARSRSRTW